MRSEDVLCRKVIDLPSAILGRSIVEPADEESERSWRAEKASSSVEVRSLQLAMMGVFLRTLSSFRTIELKMPAVSKTIHNSLVIPFP